MCTKPKNAFPAVEFGTDLPSRQARPQTPQLPWLDTAQDLLDWVRREKPCNNNQRRNEIAAIRWLGKVDERPLSSVPLDTRYLVDNRIALIRNHRALTRMRRSNIITLLNRVLRRTGILTVGARRGGITTHDWTVLINSLPKLSARASLSSLGKFCSTRGIEPDGMTLEIWQTYREETLRRSCIRNARQKIQTTIKVSNAARAAISGWPLPLLPKLPNPRSVSILKTALPRSFWSDLDTYTFMSSSAAENIFDSNWPKRLSGATLYRYRDVAWRTASAQVHAGRSAAEITNLTELLDLAWLQKAMAWFHRHAGNRFLKDHLNIAATWVSFADNYVHPPANVTAQIRNGIKKMIERNLGPAGFSTRNTARLEQFADPAAVERLLVLPYQIMAEVKRKKVITAADASEMMAAVGIELLLTTMIRSKNLADLDVYKSFWPANPTPAGAWSLVIDRCDVKNGQPLRFALPKATIGLIDFYRRECRPLLVREPTDLMFLRANGKPKGRAMMAHLTSRTIARRLDLDVNVHLFRHIGTMLYLDVHPGRFGVPQLMLGHTSERTTQKFYAHLQAAKVTKHFTAAVFGARDDRISSTP